MTQPGSQDQSSLEMLESLNSCPMCGSRNLDPRFKVRLITGDPLHAYAIELGLSVATIVACRGCSFLFKNTRPSSAYLDKLYSELSVEYLESTGEDNQEFREDFRVARRLLQTTFPKGGSILDVGCASGSFLESLGQNWDRYGVELFHLAVERSRARPGLDIHEGTIKSAGFAGGAFDVVCSFDVIEHLHNPLEIFDEARRVLKPGGLLLLGTGDSDALTARLAGSRWTYLCIPEHISFFNSCSLKKGLEKLDFSDFGFVRVHHGLRNFVSAKGWFRAVGKHWAVKLCGEDIVRMRLFRQKTAEFLVPYFFDHMICVAR
jgi:SAM-dependent methyltransferase